MQCLAVSQSQMGNIAQFCEIMTPSYVYTQRFVTLICVAMVIAREIGVCNIPRNADLFCLCSAHAPRNAVATQIEQHKSVCVNVALSILTVNIKSLSWICTRHKMLHARHFFFSLSSFCAE